MKLLVAAVGQRQPAWALTAYAEFEKRFPPELRLELHAVKAEARGRTMDLVRRCSEKPPPKEKKQ